MAAAILPAAAFAQQKPDPAGLDAVLHEMDVAATNFRNAQAEFEWDRYEKVIDEVDDVQKGTIYYRSAGKDLEMKADIKVAGPSPDQLKSEPKYVLFSGGKIRMYQPKPDQLTIWDLGKNSSEFESYLVLGFGGSGQDLSKSFEVTYLGQETVGGKDTGKLQLIPKSERVRNNFNKILIWIDMTRGISVQQQFFDPQGDYRLAKYSAIQVNEKKIPDEVFKLHTTGKTQINSPRG